jgi:hypothetical protein
VVSGEVAEAMAKMPGNYSRQIMPLEQPVMQVPKKVKAKRKWALFL